MRSFVAGLMVLSVITPAAPSEACTCAISAVQVFPAATETAPLNAHVFLIVPLTEVGGLDAVTFELRVPLSKEEEKERRRKERKARKKKKRRSEEAVDPLPAAVELARRDVVSGGVGYVELTPRAPLAAGTRYQVWMTPAGRKPAVVGEINTGSRVDQTSPTWEGVTNASVRSQAASPGTCQTGKPHVILEHKPASDADGSVLYGLWVADAKGKIDYTQAPRAFTADWNGKLALGPASLCAPSNFEVPAAGALRLGAKAIDRAGNASAASETTVAPSRPRSPVQGR